ncbi:MAG: CorA family divalent cation transporter [Ideonella sp.]|nr:CorA family divalent cation transporter [Ideonella sp.]
MRVFRCQPGQASLELGELPEDSAGRQAFCGWAARRTRVRGRHLADVQAALQPLGWRPAWSTCTSADLLNDQLPSPLRLHLVVRHAGLSALGGGARQRQLKDARRARTARHWALQAALHAHRHQSRWALRSSTSVLLTRAPGRLPRARATLPQRLWQHCSRRRRPARQRPPAHQPGRPDAAHGQPHGGQLPGAAPPADSPTRRRCKHELLDPRSRFDDWQILLESRNALHLLEDTCEDQRSAIQEWIDALDEWPLEADAAKRRDRELLRVRSRDVLEHIERVLSHVRRLEQSAEAAVQMHFSALSNRTNDIMRTLTVLTAIFLPLNLITGIFGMNFDALPLIHSSAGFFVALGLMLCVGIGLGLFFWRKRYLGTQVRR